MFPTPADKYDAIRFRVDFERVFKEITERGGAPVLVGGAGIYLTALREGFMFPTLVLERTVAELDERISMRTTLMLTSGWIEETQAALVEHSPNCPGLMSIGYREITKFLQGDLTQEELEPAIVLVTRQYAKRQRTWFRHVPAVFTGSPDNDEIRMMISEMIDGDTQP